MKKWNKIVSVWGLAAMLAVTAGCGSKQPDAAKPVEPVKPGTQNAEPAKTGNADKQDDLKTKYPLKLKDASGEEVTFEKAPAKIVSLAPSETEALFAIGLDQEIVGVTDFDDYPEAAKSKPKVAGNPEAIVAAQPDVVFAAGITNPATIKSLRGLKLKVFQFNPKTMADVTKDMKIYGQITDRQAKAKEILDQMTKERTQVEDAVKSLKEEEKKKVYIEFSPGYTVGSGEFMDELITASGGKNIAADLKGWQKINEENVIKSNPDVILYANNVKDENNKTIPDIIKSRSGWNNMNAIKNNQVKGLDDNLLSRPGPRITKGLLEVAKAIYPDKFK